MPDATCATCSTPLIPGSGRRRFCSERCARTMPEMTCDWCGKPFRSPRPNSHNRRRGGQRHCSRRCARIATSAGATPIAWAACLNCHDTFIIRTPAGYHCGPTHRADRRAPLRRAVEEGDWELMLAELRRRSTLRPGSDCWVWNGRTKDGYAIATRSQPVHRLMARTRWPWLGSLPIHHTCANGRCVNPDHHVPASHAENIAEMMARRWYEERIATLEQALADIVPGHSLLRPTPGGGPEATEPRAQTPADSFCVSRIPCG